MDSWLWQLTRKTCAAAFSSRRLFFACRAKLTLAQRPLRSSACFISRYVSLFVDLIVFISIFNKTNANTNPSSSFSAFMQNWNYPVLSISIVLLMLMFVDFCSAGMIIHSCPLLILMMLCVLLFRRQLCWR